MVFKHIINHLSFGYVHLPRFKYDFFYRFAIFLVKFLAYHLVVSPILTVATNQLTASQVFLTELMFAIRNFVADPIFS